MTTKPTTKQIGKSFLWTFWHDGREYFGYATSRPAARKEAQQTIDHLKTTGRFARI